MNDENTRGDENEVTRLRDELLALRKSVLAQNKELFRLNDDLYSADLWVLGASRRLFSLVDGFDTLVRAKNLLCALPLVRMQLDTGLRVFGLTLLSDLDQAATLLVGGKPMNKMRGTAGVLLSDAYLVRQAAEIAPWLPSMYAETSSFIHTSQRHFLAAVAQFDGDTGTVDLTIGGDDGKASESEYASVLKAFLQATRFAGAMQIDYWRWKSSARTATAIGSRNIPRL